MPIYEYVCPDCKTKFEMLRPFSKADASAECPKCHKDAKRIMSRFACVSTISDNVPTPISSGMSGGSSCSSCGSSNCGSCGIG